MDDYRHSETLEAPSPTDGQAEPIIWWKGASVYQVYPRSYFDSNGDGIGDIPGITQKLDHIASLNVDAVWLSPFFTSPMADYGYDVSDFCDVDPIFGTLADFDALIARAHELGLKVIIDQVYSHSSDQHPWFEESRSSKDNPKADWYVWVDPNPDGTPPNNWQSVFAGSAWQWDARRQQYYLHNFLPEQPDLNLHNPDVRAAIMAIPKFWLDRGVDGFRLDALNFGFHNRDLTNNPPATKFKRPPTRPHDFQSHIHNMSQPEIYPFLQGIRELMDSYADRFTVAEIGGPFPLDEMKAYTGGEKRLNTAYAFDFLYAEQLNAKLVRNVLSQWPGGAMDGWPSWAFSNHDAPRAVTRWRGECPQDDYAKLLCLLMVAMRGNIFFWQGEELGLEQAEIAFEDLKDPEAIANWPHTLGRDGARTPMPWRNGNQYAGFSEAKPWLPVDSRHLSNSVTEQDKDENSVLAFYRQALALRGSSDALKLGSLDIRLPESDLLIFDRALNGQTIRAIINLTSEKFSLEDCRGEILLQTPNFKTGIIPAYSGALIGR